MTSKSVARNSMKFKKIKILPAAFYSRRNAYMPDCQSIECHNQLPQPAFLFDLIFIKVSIQSVYADKHVPMQPELPYFGNNGAISANWYIIPLKKYERWY